jgi:hypothetical protein
MLNDESLEVNVAISRKNSRVSMQFSVLTRKMAGNGNELISYARVGRFRLSRQIAVKYCNMGCRGFF